MKSVWADAVKQYDGRAPERQDQRHGARERGLQVQAHDHDAGRQGARHLPVLGRRHAQGAGRRRASCRTSPSPPRPGSADLNPAAAGLYQPRRQAVRRPVQPRHGRRLVPQVAVREGRASTPRRPPGTSSSPTSRRSRTPASRRSPWARRTSGPGMFWWANLRLRIAGKDALAQAGEDGSFDSPGFVKAGEELKTPDRHAAVPEGLPGRAVGRRRRRGRADRQRQGRDET